MTSTTTDVTIPSYSGRAFRPLDSVQDSDDMNALEKEAYWHYIRQLHNFGRTGIDYRPLEREVVIRKLEESGTWLSRSSPHFSPRLD